MTPAELSAVDAYLTDYPSAKTFDEVVEMIRLGDERVLVRQWVEHIPVDDLIELIESALWNANASGRFT